MERGEKIEQRLELDGIKRLAVDLSLMASYKLGPWHFSHLTNWFIPRGVSAVAHNKPHMSCVTTAVIGLWA